MFARFKNAPTTLSRYRFGQKNAIPTDSTPEAAPMIVCGIISLGTLRIQQGSHTFMAMDVSFVDGPTGRQWLTIGDEVKILRGVGVHKIVEKAPASPTGKVVQMPRKAKKIEQRYAG